MKKRQDRFGPLQKLRIYLKLTALQASVLHYHFRLLLREPSRGWRNPAAAQCAGKKWDMDNGICIEPHSHTEERRSIDCIQYTHEGNTPPLLPWHYYISAICDAKYLKKSWPLSLTLRHRNIANIESLTLGHTIQNYPKMSLILSLAIKQQKEIW